MRKHVKDQENAASSHIGHDQMSSAGDGRKVFVLFEDGSLEVPVNEGMYIGVSWFTKLYVSFYVYVCMYVCLYSLYVCVRM